VIDILALVFSDCSFLTKTLTAYNAGAIAVVIKDNDNENSQFMIDMIDDGTARPVDIGAFFMFGKDGSVLLLLCVIYATAVVCVVHCEIESCIYDRLVS